MLERLKKRTYIFSWEMHPRGIAYVVAQHYFWAHREGYMGQSSDADLTLLRISDCLPWHIAMSFILALVPHLHPALL